MLLLSILCCWIRSTKATGSKGMIYQLSCLLHFPHPPGNPGPGHCVICHFLLQPGHTPTVSKLFHVVPQLQFHHAPPSGSQEHFGQIILIFSMVGLFFFDMCRQRVAAFQIDSRLSPCRVNCRKRLGDDGWVMVACLRVVFSGNSPASLLPFPGYGILCCLPYPPIR